MPGNRPGRCAQKNAVRALLRRCIPRPVAPPAAFRAGKGSALPKQGALPQKTVCPASPPLRCSAPQGGRRPRARRAARGAELCCSAPPKRPHQKRRPCCKPAAAAHPPENLGRTCKKMHKKQAAAASPRFKSAPEALRRGQRQPLSFFWAVFYSAKALKAR